MNEDEVKDVNEVKDVKEVEPTAKVNFDHSFDRSIYMTAEVIQGNVPEVFSMSCTRIAKAIANPVIKAMLIAKLQRPISAETQWAKDAVFALLLSDVTIKLQVIDLHVGDDDPDRKGTPIDADTQRVRFAEPLKVSATILPTAIQLVKEIANVVTAPVAVNPFQ